MSLTPRILVIGGAVAGASCAIALRHRDVDVTVVERELFPRPKVCGCCLGGSGIKLLDQLGVLRQVTGEAVATHRWIGVFDGRRIEIPMDQGIAISRESLDPILLDEAARLGADVRMQCEASVQEVAESAIIVDLQCDGHLRTERFDFVVIAAGLRSGDVAGMLPWTEKPNGPFGVSMMAQSMTTQSNDLETGHIVMICDDDGYVGLVRLADGRIDIAAALQSGADAAAGRKPIDRVEGMIQRAGLRFDFRDRSPVMTTPPLRRTRRSGAGRILAIGDAAGYVEPFTGEGMTWAMESGIAASESIARSLADPCDLDSLGQRWDVELQQLLRGKKRTCRVLTTALRSPTARLAVAKTLAVFPGLARPLLNHLAK
jgi:flavin-dependent dehydrogenase